MQYLLRKHDIRGGKNAKLDLDEFKGVLHDIEDARRKNKDGDDPRTSGGDAGKARTLDDDDVE